MSAALEPVEVRRRTCDGCDRNTLLRDLRCNDKFTGLYCRTCLPVAITDRVISPGSQDSL